MTTHTIRVLGGSDVTREPVEVVLELRDGELHDAQYGDRLEVRPGTDLRGWGDLDGPAVDLVYPSGSYVTAPVAGFDVEWWRPWLLDWAQEIVEGVAGAREELEPWAAGEIDLGLLSGWERIPEALHPQAGEILDERVQELARVELEGDGKSVSEAGKVEVERL
jgi:hypothetical protein